MGRIFLFKIINEFDFGSALTLSKHFNMQIELNLSKLF